MAKISVKKLFGYFDYDFDFGDMTGAGLTILTGPNGFGKTTILKCINAISTSDLSFFADLKFKSFEVEREETGEKIRIEKQENGLKVNEMELSNREIALLSRGILNRRGVRDGRGEEGIRSEQEQNKIRTRQMLNQILNQMQSIFGKIQHIKEQRLTEGENTKTVASHQVDGRTVYRKELSGGVNSIPEKLVREMRSYNFRYSQLSNELDSTFPQRLFKMEEGINEEEFERKIEQMGERIEKLNLNGISRIEKLDVAKFNKEDARALKVYFEDFDKKYQLYEEMIEKLELFREIINKRFRFKHLEITAEQGIEIRDDETRDKIRLNCLSSGEQEILVLYYMLLFETPEGMIVLIDEPEISLHIAWQRMFVQDLKRIVDLKKIYAVIATHSPQMISGNQNIQYDLGEMYINGLD